MSLFAKNFVRLHRQKIQMLMEKRKHRPLLLIDIAVPRDIDPEVRAVHQVSLYDIDDLRQVAESNHKIKEIAAGEAEKMIGEEMARYKEWHNALFVAPTLTALQQRGEEIKKINLAKALAKLDGLTPKQGKVIHRLADSIVKQLLHFPLSKLHEAANTPQGYLYTETLQKLFDLDPEEELSPDNQTNIRAAEKVQ
nr:hypothetical protein [Syntrophobotulus glycolicus]